MSAADGLAGARDPRLAAALEAARDLAVREPLTVAASASVRRLAGPGGPCRWVSYEDLAAADTARAAGVLLYMAGLHLPPPELLSDVIRRWRPVFGNGAYILFYRGDREPRHLGGETEALRSLSFCLERLDEARATGRYLSVAGVSFECRPSTSDMGAVEEAAAAYGLKDLVLAEDAVVVDIGAHIGGFALPAALRASSGRLVACEPDPGNAAWLERNLRGRRGAQVVTAALAGTEGERSFYPCASNPALSNLLGPIEPGPALKARCVTLDSLAREHRLERVDLLKIDAKGLEAEALRASAGFLRERVRRVLVKDHEARGAGGGGLAASLEALGFRVRRTAGVNWTLLDAAAGGKGRAARGLRRMKRGFQF